MRILILILFLMSPLVSMAGDNVWSSRGPLGGTFPSIVFLPANNNTVFAGSYDGLYRSLNSGSTWQRVDLPEGADFPVNIRIPRQSTGTIYASTESFLFRSTDQGNNWQQVSRLPAEFAEFEFHPADQNILYGVTLRKGVYRSNDGGRTWVARSAGLRLTPVQECCDIPQLEVDPTNGSIVYVLLATRLAFRSGNGGDSWSAINQGLHFTDEIRSVVIDPVTPQTVYVGGADGVFKSTNAGAAWTNLDCDCLARGIALDPRNNQVLYVAGIGVRKSVNGGNSWTTLSSGAFTNTGLMSIGLSPASASLLIAGGDGDGIFRSANGGNTWVRVNNLVDATPIRHVSSSPQRPADIFAQGDFQLFRSRNAGQTWTLWPFGHDFETTDVEAHPRNANVVVATGFFDDAGVAISVNGGTSWLQRSPNGADGANAVALNPTNDNVIFVSALSGGQKLGLARSMDRGNSWQFVNSGITDKSILDIAVDPSNGATMYISTSTGKVFKSGDGGTSWRSSSSGLKGGAVNSIAITPSNSNTLYAATARGIYKSINAGGAWVAKSRGLPPGELRFVKVDPSAPQVVFCGGEDLLFVSADAGENWSSFDTNGLGRYLATDMLINPAQPSIFHLGVNRGAFSYKKSTVQGGPEIVQLSPPSGRSGDTITLQGKNFGASQGASRVLFGSTDGGTAVSWSDTRIQVRVPSGAQTAPVAVLVGSRRSNALQFIVVSSSGGVQPSAGPAGGGTRVSIASPVALRSLSFVLFGTSFAKEIQFVPPNTITCKTPTGSGTVDVMIISVSGNVKAGTFTFQ